jgi:hypothetical protein
MDSLTAYISGMVDFHIMTSILFGISIKFSFHRYITLNYLMTMCSFEKSADVSDVTFRGVSFKKNVQNVIIDSCNKFHASFTI